MPPIAWCFLSVLRNSQPVFLLILLIFVFLSSFWNSVIDMWDFFIMFHVSLIFFSISSSCFNYILSTCIFLQFYRYIFSLSCVKSVYVLISVFCKVPDFYLILKLNSNFLVKIFHLCIYIWNILNIVIFKFIPSNSTIWNFCWWTFAFIPLSFSVIWSCFPIGLVIFGWIPELVNRKVLGLWVMLSFLL